MSLNRVSGDLHNTNDFYNHLKEMTKAQKIEDLGMFMVPLNDFLISEDTKHYLHEIIKFGTAAALETMHYQTPKALCLRELSPYNDLTTPDGSYHQHNQWIQKLDTIRNDDDRGLIPYPVYETNKNVKNDQKVIMVYGLEFLNSFKHKSAEWVEFWRSRVKLIAKADINHPAPHFRRFETPIIDTMSGEADKNLSPAMVTGIKNTMYHNDMVFFSTPIIYIKDSLMQIKFVYSDRTPFDAVDEIKIKGFVWEPIGMTVMG